MAETGTFIVSYESVEQPPGAQVLRLNLLVDPLDTLQNGGEQLGAHTPVEEETRSGFHH